MREDLEARLRRSRALIVKETRQLLRDPASLLLGIALPVILILLLGFGLSLDVVHVRVALVDEEHGPVAAAVRARLVGAGMFELASAPSPREAAARLTAGSADAIVRIPLHAAQAQAHGTATVAVMVDGIDANYARLVEAACTGALTGPASLADAATVVSTPALAPQERLWFNENHDSHAFLVPGLVVLAVTVIGAFLTALVMAREWERGTFEALIVTPVRPFEILLGKTVPYFVLGLIALVLCLLASRFLFDVPMRGSPLLVLGAGMLYLLVTLGLGLVISTTVRNQFLASQIVLLATFLPATLLSGFLFDVHSMPLVVQALTWLVPARYLVELLQTLLLAGSGGMLMLRDLGILALFALLLLGLSLRRMRKSLA